MAMVIFQRLLVSVLAACLVATSMLSVPVAAQELPSGGDLQDPSSTEDAPPLEDAEPVPSVASREISRDELVDESSGGDSSGRSVGEPEPPGWEPEQAGEHLRPGAQVQVGETPVEIELTTDEVSDPSRSPDELDDGRVNDDRGDSEPAVSEVWVNVLDEELASQVSPVGAAVAVSFTDDTGDELSLIHI